MRLCRKSRYRFLKRFNNMSKIYITTREAAILSRLLEKVAKMVNSSQVIAAACDIDRHDTKIIDDIQNRIKQ